MVKLRLAANPSAIPAIFGRRLEATTLTRLDCPEAITFGAIYIPSGVELQPWEFAWQVFGHPFEQRTAVALMAGPGLVKTVSEIPTSGPAEMRLGDGVLHRVLLPATPLWLRRFIGWDPEVWLGVAEQRVWVGFGPPDAARRKLEEAHAVTAGKANAEDRPVAITMRLSARDLVGLAAGFDPGWIDQQLARGGDQVRLVLEPGRETVTLRAAFDVGVLRVLGAAVAHELSLELDQLLAAPMDGQEGAP
jgi:hypothetical protein